ncbi:MAG: glycosyltransferase family 2 protein [Alphaproteobacteria bacterium]
MIPTFSIVIPLCNESGNIVPLAKEIIAALDRANPHPGPYEVIFVDDGSTDESAQEVQSLWASYPDFRLLAHNARMGSSTAFRTGIAAARARWIVTLDGDGQNDPADIPRLLQLAWACGHDDSILVCGVRVNRRDTLLKRLASKFANAVRRRMLDDGAPDTGCALKVFRRDTYLDLPFFKGLHRFMPAMFRAFGHEVLHTPVNDRLRLRGQSKSDILGRGIRGFFDLFGVAWLIRRNRGSPQVTECRVERTVAAAKTGTR